MELNKRIGAILLFFIMFFVQSVQVRLGKRESIDVTFPTRTQEETAINFDSRYLTSKPTTSPSTSVVIPTSEGYIPSGSDEDIWSISFGGSGSDIVRSSCFLSDCGYLVCGNSSSDDGTFLNACRRDYSLPYAFVAKFSSTGKLKWVNSIGGNGLTVANDVTELKDGSIICVGYTLATNLIGNSPADDDVIDLFIIHYDSNGNVISKFVPEGSGYDYCYCVDACPDGGYVVGGSSTSRDGYFNFSGNAAFIKKYSSDDILLSGVEYCGLTGGTVFDIDASENGNIFAALVTNCSDGDFSRFDGIAKGLSDSLIIKYSSDLSQIKWYVPIASSGNDRFEHICEDGNGGCVAAGYFNTRYDSGITDGFFSNYPCYGLADGYAVKINSTGVITSRHSFGGTQNDYITDVMKSGSSFVFTGYTKSSDFTFSTLGNIGNYDSFVSVLDESTFDSSPTVTHYIAGTGEDTVKTVCGYEHEFVVFGTTDSTDEFFWTTTPPVTSEKSAFAVKYSVSN